VKAVLAHVCLLLDIVSVKILVWALGRDGELLDSHLFFFDRYSDLADYHRQHGRIAKADRLAAIAEAHYQAAPGDDEPPAAAAMAMSAPRPMTRTNAVSATPTKKPSSAGRSHGAGLGHELVHVGHDRDGTLGRTKYLRELSRPRSLARFVFCVLAAVVGHLALVACDDRQLERGFLRQPFETRIARLNTYSLEDQYKIFRYGNDRVEPPVLELANPIAQRGSAAVPFLIGKLESETDDISLRDILHILEMMAAFKTYDVKADADLVALLRTRLDGMKDPEWQAICRKMLQRALEGRATSP
jgi:hypothetical protein